MAKKLLQSSCFDFVSGSIKHLKKTQDLTIKKDLRLKAVINVYFMKEENTSPFQKKLFVYCQVLKLSENLWWRLIIN